MHADLRTQGPEALCEYWMALLRTAEVAPFTCSPHAHVDEPNPGFHDVAAASLDDGEQNARHPKGRMTGGG